MRWLDAGRESADCQEDSRSQTAGRRTTVRFLAFGTQASNTGTSNIESVVTLRTELDLRECAVPSSELRPRIKGADATTQHAQTARTMYRNPNAENRDSTSSCDLGPAGTRFVA
jgi:hypothetical protein